MSCLHLGVGLPSGVPGHSVSRASLRDDCGTRRSLFLRYCLLPFYKVTEAIQALGKKTIPAEPKSVIGTVYRGFLGYFSSVLCYKQIFWVTKTVVNTIIRVARERAASLERPTVGLMSQHIAKSGEPACCLRVSSFCLLAGLCPPWQRPTLMHPESVLS